MKTAYATIKGFEVMRALRKDQRRAVNLTSDPIGEKRMIDRALLDNLQQSPLWGALMQPTLSTLKNLRHVPLK